MSKSLEELRRVHGIRVGPEWAGDPADDPDNFNVGATAIALMKAGERDLGHRLMLAGLADAREIVAENLDVIRKYKVAKVNQ